MASVRESLATDTDQHLLRCWTLIITPMLLLVMFPSLNSFNIHWKWMQILQNFIVSRHFYFCMHCIFSVGVYGTLESVTVLRHLRNCRDIIIIIIIIIEKVKKEWRG